MTMTDDAVATLREQILADPDLILEDQALMRALLHADRGSAGRNVVDLRGVLVERLEDRLDRLEDTHREVLAAAYENVAGMNQVHRACLALLEPARFEDVLKVLAREAATILGVEIIRLALEDAPDVDSPVLVALPAGGADAYITQGRGLGARKVTLRRLDRASPDIYGAHAGRIRSEAVLRLDRGPGSAPALLVLGTGEDLRFHADQGVDLLTFFTGVVERVLRRWS